jgi:hypothetical protein
VSERAEGRVALLDDSLQHTDGPLTVPALAHVLDQDLEQLAVRVPEGEGVPVLETGHRAGGVVADHRGVFRLERCEGIGIGDHRVSHAAVASHP